MQHIFVWNRLACFSLKVIDAVQTKTTIAMCIIDFYVRRILETPRAVCVFGRAAANNDRLAFA